MPCVLHLQHLDQYLMSSWLQMADLPRISTNNSIATNWRIPRLRNHNATDDGKRRPQIFLKSFRFEA